MPFFSPDGQWVGFVVGGRVNKISVEGGAVVPLGQVANFAGASWGEDGRIIVSDALGNGLLRMPASGGPPETVAGVGNGERGLVIPQILPGGKAILFAAIPALDVDKFTIEVLTLADRRRKIVARGGPSPRYLATSNGAGHVLYINKGTLFAIPFDLDTLETRGTAVPVLDDVAYNALVGSGEFDVSRTGTLVYRRSSGGASALTTVQWVDPTGRKEPLRAKPGVYRDQACPPDGTRIALTVTEGGSDIWVYDSQRDAMTRLTSGGAAYRYPLWSPDGHYVVFSSVGWRHFPGSRGWRQPAAGADAERVEPGSVVVHAGWQAAGLFRRRREHPNLDGAAGGPGRPVESRDAGAISQEQLQRRVRRRSRPTGDGWRINRTNRERMKCTSARFRRPRLDKAASGRSRTTAARFRAGRGPDTSWCTSRATRSWPRATP